MPDLPTVNPVNLFGQIPADKPTYGHIMAESLGVWQFNLYPQLWRNSQLELIRTTSWNKVQFEESNKSNIPIGSGVYLFTVEGRTDLLPSHVYLFYAGKAAKGLRSRYEDYLREREGEEPDSDRPKITKFLTYFKGWVYFYYAEFPKDQVEVIEAAIKDNLTPPANTIISIKGRLYP